MHSIALLPQEGLVVAPHLSKTGLRITCPERGMTVLDLAREGLVTRQLLRERGFLVVDNFEPPEQAEYEDGVVRGHFLQAPHLDPDLGLVSLRTHPRVQMSDAQTVVSAVNDTRKAFRLFVEKHRSEVAVAPETFLGSYRDILPSKMRTSFYQDPDVRRHLYFHTWESSQALLLDNTEEGVYHARGSECKNEGCMACRNGEMYPPDASVVPQLLQGTFRWDENGKDIRPFYKNAA